MQKSECIRVCVLQIVDCVKRQLFVRLSNLSATVGIRAVLAKLARLLLLVVLTLLSLEVVVRNIEHFVFDFHRQRLSKTKVRIANILKAGRSY